MSLTRVMFPEVTRLAKDSRVVESRRCSPANVMKRQAFLRSTTFALSIGPLHCQPAHYFREARYHFITKTTAPTLFLDLPIPQCGFCRLTAPGRSGRCLTRYWVRALMDIATQDHGKVKLGDGVP